MKVKDIEDDLVKFNKQLEAIEKMHGIIPPKQNQDGILNNPLIDNLISFDTKVLFLTNYFEVKHAEIMATKQGVWLKATRTAHNKVK